MDQEQPSCEARINKDDLTDRSNAPDFSAAEGDDVAAESLGSSKDTAHGRTGHSVAQSPEDLTDRSISPDFSAVERHPESDASGEEQVNIREASRASHSEERKDMSDRSNFPERSTEDGRD